MVTVKGSVVEMEAPEVLTEPAAEPVTCGFCGTEFIEDPSQAACQGCPLNSACGLMRCPECGYENPKAPRWINRIRKWVGR